jgi:hypothetical protein
METETLRRPLDRLEIASPCTADWDAMAGDDKRRFCSQCRLHVHDLSAMSSDEALDLLRAAGQGRLCVRLWRRADGTVLTRDCPVGLRRRLRLMWARAAALALTLWTALGCTRSAPRGGGATGGEMGGAVPSRVEMGDAVAPPRATMGEAALPAAGSNGTAAPQQPAPAPAPAPSPIMGKVRAR